MKPKSGILIVAALLATVLATTAAAADKPSIVLINMDNFGCGALGGAVSGGLADVGIEDKMMKALAGNMTPGSSTLFVLVSKSQDDKVVPEISKFGGKVIKTSLSHEDEAVLQAALDQGQKASAWLHWLFQPGIFPFIPG